MMIRPYGPVLSVSPYNLRLRGDARCRSNGPAKAELWTERWCGSTRERRSHTELPISIRYYGFTMRMSSM